MYRDPVFSLFQTYDIPHYYGDRVRQLFMASAALSAVAIPIWGDLLPYGTLAQVGAILFLVLLAGITNPHGKVVLWLDVLASGAGVLLLEAVAINQYAIDSFALFLCREITAILLLFALYFSVKTVRAMMEGVLGKVAQPGEFRDDH